MSEQPAPLSDERLQKITDTAQCAVERKSGALALDCCRFDVPRLVAETARLTAEVERERQRAEEAERRVTELGDGYECLQKVHADNELLCFELANGSDSLQRRLKTAEAEVERLQIALEKHVELLESVKCSRGGLAELYEAEKARRREAKAEVERLQEQIVSQRGWMATLEDRAEKAEAECDQAPGRENASAEHERDLWRETARKYAQNATFWREKAEKERAAAAIIDVLEAQRVTALRDLDQAGIRAEAAEAERDKWQAEAIDRLDELKLKNLEINQRVEEATAYRARIVTTENRAEAAEHRADLRTSEVLDLEVRLAAAEAELITATARAIAAEKKLEERTNGQGHMTWLDLFAAKDLAEAERDQAIKQRDEANTGIANLTRHAEFMTEWWNARWAGLRELIREQCPEIESLACAVVANGKATPTEPYRDYIGEIDALQQRLAGVKQERDQARTERDVLGADANALRELVNSIVDWDKEWHGLELEITKAALDRGAGAAWLREHDRTIITLLKRARGWIGFNAASFGSPMTPATTELLADIDAALGAAEGKESAAKQECPACWGSGAGMDPIYGCFTCRGTGQIDKALGAAGQGDGDGE